MPGNGTSATQPNTTPASNFASNLIDGKFWGQLLLYPLRSLPTDFDNLSRRIDTSSSLVRVLTAVMGIAAGAVAVFFWPFLSSWVLNIVTAFFGEALATSWLGVLLKAYVGGALIGSVAKFSVSDVGLRLVNSCRYSDPDYFLSNSDVRRLLEEFPDHLDEDEIRELAKALVIAIRANAPIPGIENIGGREVYIEIFTRFKAGDISCLEQAIKILRAVDNELDRVDAQLAELERELAERHPRTPRPAADLVDISASSLHRSASDPTLNHSSPIRDDDSLSHDDAVASAVLTERAIAEPRPSTRLTHADRGNPAQQRWSSLLRRMDSMPDAHARIRAENGSGAGGYGTDRPPTTVISSSAVPDADELLVRIQQARQACRNARETRQGRIGLACYQPRRREERDRLPTHHVIDIESLRHREDDEVALHIALAPPPSLHSSHHSRSRSTSPSDSLHLELVGVDLADDRDSTNVRRSSPTPSV